MPHPEKESFLVAFNEEDQARLRRFDNRAQRYAIPSYLWNIAINELSEVRFSQTMREGNVPRRAPIIEVAEPPIIKTIANFELALLTAEC